MSKLNKILWGIVLVAAGIILGVNALGIADIELFFDGWWTLLIILPCFVGIFTDKEKIGNIIGLVIGVLLLLGCQNIINFGIILKLIVPIIVVLIGIKMILGASFKNMGSKIQKKLEAEGKKLNGSFAAFSGNDLRFDNELFEGAELTAVFGGIKCDLRGAIFTKDCVINASATFGGIDILVPDGINVKINSNFIFGGCGDKKHKAPDANAYTLYINASGMFGGVDVK